MLNTPLAKSALACVLFYGAILIAISYRTARKNKSSTGKEFFLGKGIGPFVLMFSTLAACFSTWVVMGCPTTTFTTGWQWIGLVTLYQMTFAFASGYLGPRIWRLRREYDYVTHGDIVAHYYGGSSALRYLVAFSFLMTCTTHTIGQFRAIGTAVSTVTGINLAYIVILIAVFIITYVCVGGYHGTALIDTFQGLVFCLIIFGGFVLVLFKLGGLSNLFNEVAAVDSKLILYNGNMEGTLWPTQTAISFSFVGIIGGITTPSFWLRYYTADKPESITKMSVRTSILGSIIVSTTSGLIGLSAHAFMARGMAQIDNPSTVFQSLLSQVAGSYWVLLVIFACLAAGMSSIAGNMNMSSMAVTYDVVHKVDSKIDDRKLGMVGRGVLIILTVICAYLAVHTSDALTSIVQVAVGFAATPLFPIMGMFVWKRATKEGAVAGMVGSLAAQIFSVAVVKNPLGIVGGAWGFIIGMILFVAVSLMTKPYTQEYRDKYFAPLKKGRVFSYTNAD